MVCNPSDTLNRYKRDLERTMIFHFRMAQKFDYFFGSLNFDFFMFKISNLFK